MNEVRMTLFDNYTLDECGYKILEEAAEVYAAWQAIYKDGCECGSCNVNIICQDHQILADELYDVLQVCEHQRPFRRHAWL